MTPAERKEKQYDVNQSWKIAQPVDVAAKLLDIAVDAGANDVGDPQWILADPDAAEARLMRPHWRKLAVSQIRWPSLSVQNRCSLVRHQRSEGKPVCYFEHHGIRHRGRKNRFGQT
jgi:hypothetical protein